MIVVTCFGIRSIDCWKPYIALGSNCFERFFLVKNTLSKMKVTMVDEPYERSIQFEMEDINYGKFNRNKNSRKP